MGGGDEPPLGPRRYLSTPTSAAGPSWTCSPGSAPSARTGGRPRLRPREPHRPAGRSAGRAPTWSASTPRPRWSARRRVGRRRVCASRSATCAPGGRPSPSTYSFSNATLPVGARPPRPAARTWSGTSPPTAGSPSRCRATTPSPATCCSTSSPPTPASPPYTDGVARPHSHDPAVYADALLDLGLSVDAWETTYLHLLTGEDPVFTWISGTGARPTLQALPEDLRRAFRGGVQGAAARGLPARPARHHAAVPPRLRGRREGRLIVREGGPDGPCGAIVALPARGRDPRGARGRRRPSRPTAPPSTRSPPTAHQQLLVGELDGEVVATAQVTWVRRLTYVGGEMGVVESVRVRSDLRGRGLGEQLMRHVLDLARGRGAVRVELTTQRAARPRRAGSTSGSGSPRRTSA